MPPEMWLLPSALPVRRCCCACRSRRRDPRADAAVPARPQVHPGRMWCHCRMVYLPMCYVFGVKGTGPRSALTDAIKGELYTAPYESIDWNAARSACAPEDLYYPHPALQDAIWWVLHKAEPMLFGSRLRKCVCAVRVCMRLLVCPVMC